MRRALSAALEAPLLRFCVVGTVGFCVDAAVLLFTIQQLGPKGGRGVSLLCSMGVTWALNRTITFDAPSRLTRLGAEFVAYIGLMSLGALINFLVYLAASHVSVSVRNHPAIGVAIGSVTGLLFNFLAARRLFGWSRDGAARGKRHEL